MQPLGPLIVGDGLHRLIFKRPVIPNVPMTLRHDPLHFGLDDFAALGRFFQGSHQRFARFKAQDLGGCLRVQFAFQAINAGMGFVERARPLFAELLHQGVFLEGEGRPIFELSSPQHGHGPEIGLGIHPLFDCRPDIGRLFLPFPCLFPHRSRVELGQDLALGLLHFQILFPCVALKVLFGHPGFFSRSE